MTIHCAAATEAQIAAWESRYKELPATHPLKRDRDLTICYADGVVVFQGREGGFYFRRGGLEEAAAAEFAATHREYLCSPFELVANPRDGKADPTPLLQRFEDLYGRRAKQIDTHLFSHNGVTLLLALFPSNIVREMMAPHGGILKTVFKGNTRDLRRIPALQHFLHFPDEDADVESVFATQYDKGNYEAVRALHYQIVKDVIEIKRDRGGPITLGPIGQWDA